LKDPGDTDNIQIAIKKQVKLAGADGKYYMSLIRISKKIVRKETQCLGEISKSFLWKR
jgi:hypothetical protein